MDKEDILADEELLIRDGGEMPEVTFHSSLNYLTHDDDGPRLILNSDDIRRLKKAVVHGYKQIILRDLTPDNRDKGLYRGLERCCLNWQRLENFCRREALDLKEVRREVSEFLKRFMSIEVKEVIEGQRPSSINCRPDDIHCLCENLRIDPKEFPDGWQKLCVG